MKLLLYKLIKGWQLVILTFLAWLNLMLDNFIFHFGGEDKYYQVFKENCDNFWESFTYIVAVYGYYSDVSLNPKNFK